MTPTEEAKAIREAWGEAVRRTRKQRGMSQAAVGRAAGVSAGSVSAIELAVREPSLKVAIAVARALGVTYSELFQASPGAEEAS